MKAIITGIESGSKYTDKEMRVTLKLMDADHCFNEVRFALSKLGLNGVGTGPHLDQEIEVTFLGKGKK